MYYKFLWFCINVKSVIIQLIINIISMKPYDYIEKLENKIANHEQTIKNLNTELSIMRIKLER